MTDLIDYYRRGGSCIDYNDECRDRSSGCPCTETADALEAQQAVRNGRMVVSEISELIEKLRSVRQRTANMCGHVEDWSEHDPL